MKKVFAIVLALCCILALTACGTNANESSTATQDINAKSEGVMTYAEFDAAAIDDAVVIEAYIQDKQVYAAEYGNTSLYLQDADGGYFAYRIAMTQAEYDSLTKGTKVKISGTKAMWPENDGEVEIADATFEIEEGTYIAEATDVTALLGTDALKDHMNQFVSFNGMTVEEIGEGQAFLYNWDGSGEDGSDLYFNVSYNGATYNFCVETDLCPVGSDVYEMVKSLNVGDTIDLTGFLYWYTGANPHITSVTLQ